LLSIAIPDSVFADERDSLRGKTIKTGLIARSASIFGVSRIYVYRDSSANYERDYITFRTILEYAETPPYLRKALVPRTKDLEFAGLLTPLRTPSHLVEAVPKLGEVREAVLKIQNNALLADIGAKELAIFEGRGHAGQRVTVRVKALSPLRVIVEGRPTDLHWGYEVRRAPTLARFLRSVHFELVVLTSRLGQPVNECWEEFFQRSKSAPQKLFCFGSPLAGIQEMLKQDGASVKDFPGHLLLNMFPSQNVETIRLEEAVLGSLAISNIACSL
jgi:predicted SPOUT superfamily RNA methylase MTH1